MPELSALGYLATKAITESEGLPEERVKELSLVGAMFGLTPTWLIVAQTIARREHAEEFVQPDGDASGQPQVGAGSEKPKG